MAELTPQNFVIWVSVGGMFGWIADAAFKATKLGALGNIAVGIVGAFTAALMVDFFDVVVNVGTSPFLQRSLVAFMGAITLLAIVAAFERATK